jgi:hypothetical protein
MLAAGHTETFNFRKCSNGMPVLATYRRRSLPFRRCMTAQRRVAARRCVLSAPKRRPAANRSREPAAQRGLKTATRERIPPGRRTPWLDKDLVIAAIIAQRAHGSQEPHRPSDPEIA